MKDRLNCLLSEVGESFDYLRSDVRNLSRYMAELEELIESYRTFATTLTLSTSVERATRRKLLKKTLRVVGPATDARQEENSSAWTSRRQTILSLPPIRVARIPMSCGVVSTRTSPDESSHPLFMDLKSGWVG